MRIYKVAEKCFNKKKNTNKFSFSKVAGVRPAFLVIRNDVL